MPPTSVSASTPEEVLYWLARGLCPQVTDEDVLVALGFEPLYPHAVGPDARKWARQVDRGVSPDGRRRLALERADFVGDRPRRHLPAVDAA